MSTKKWKNKELNGLLNEKWGFSMDLNKLNESKKEYDLEKGHDRIFAPNHYCLHHVIYEGKQGQTVDHNWDEKLQKVTKYDVKFGDGSIVRNIHESKLTVVEAFTESDHSGKKDDGHPPVKKEEKEDNVAARTAPFDKKNKSDFLPKDVRDKINNKGKKKEVNEAEDDKDMGDNPEGVTELMDAINGLSEKESEEVYKMLRDKHEKEKKKDSPMDMKERKLKEAIQKIIKSKLNKRKK